MSGFPVRGGPAHRRGVVSSLGMRENCVLDKRNLTVRLFISSERVMFVVHEHLNEKKHIMAKATYQNLKEASQFNKLQEIFEQWLRESFDTWSSKLGLARLELEDYCVGLFDNRGRVHNNTDDGRPLHRASQIGLAREAFEAAMYNQTVRWLDQVSVDKDKAAFEVISKVTANAQRNVGDTTVDFYFSSDQAEIAEFAHALLVENTDTSLKEIHLSEI